MKESQYPTTIAQHIRDFKSNDGEKAYTDRILKCYRGEYWTGPGNITETELQKMSLNLLYAVTDSALSTLVPPNPQVDAKPRSPSAKPLMQTASDLVNLAFDTGRYRRELGTATFRTLVHGHGVTKTVWNPKTDLPLVRALNPSNLFFDLVAERPEDIRYWIELTLVGEEEWEKRVTAGKYDKTQAALYKADTFPRWMLPMDDVKLASLDDEKLRNYQRWHVVYECYDMESGNCYHFCPDTELPLFKAPMAYLPYDLVTFSPNGRDCKGLSDLGLILANQEEYNLLATYLHNIVRYQLSRHGYDANAMDTDAAVAVAKAPLGSLVPFKIKEDFRNRNPGVKAADLVWPIPTVGATVEQMDLLARLREGIAYVSAIADAQRGQVVGAKTATELALIEGQIRNRLRSRQTALDELTQSVAEKCLFLAGKYMREEKVVEGAARVGGAPADVLIPREQQKEWREIVPYDLEDIKARFEVVAYSPAESNKAVRAEVMRSLMDSFVGNPNINQREFFAELLKLLDLPDTVLASPEAVAAALQPTPPAPAPALPAPAPVDPNAVPLPPQVQALANAQVPGPMGPVPPGEMPLGGGPVVTPPVG